MNIPWYMNDPRFAPGTVADVGLSLRLSLSQPKSKDGSEWRLYMAIRTWKKDGVADTLKTKCLVAVFKKCQSLEEAQRRSEKWFSNWRRGLS